MSAPDADEELMLRYRNGDVRAFETLYARHKAPLFRYVTRLTGPAAVAEELFQDIWTKVIQARSTYEVRAKFTTWLYRLAHNRIVDHYRRTASDARLVHDDGSDESMLDSLPDEPFREPDNELDRARLARRLVEAVGTLPEAQRDVFLLREEAELTLDEIATVTGINTEAAKSRLRYALAKLRQQLKDVGSP